MSPEISPDAKVGFDPPLYKFTGDVSLCDTVSGHRIRGPVPCSVLALTLEEATQKVKAVVGDPPEHNRRWYYAVDGIEEVAG